MKRSNKTSNLILLFILVINVGCALADSDEDLFVVYGVKSLIKLDSEPRLSPWLIEADEKAVILKGDFDEVGLYSAGCHFFEVTYFAENLSGAPIELPVRFQPGEFCDVSGYMFAHPTLIKVKRWDGTYYLGVSSRLRFDDKDSPFIVGDQTISEFGFQALYVQIENIESACEDLKYLSEIELTRMLDDPTAVRSSSDSVCYSKGVYISSLKK